MGCLGTAFQQNWRRVEQGHPLLLCYFDSGTSIENRELTLQPNAVRFLWPLEYLLRLICPVHCRILLPRRKVSYILDRFDCNTKKIRSSAGSIPVDHTGFLKK